MDKLYLAGISAVLFVALVPRKRLMLGGKYSIFIHALIFGVVSYGLYMFFFPKEKSLDKKAVDLAKQAAGVAQEKASDAWSWLYGKATAKGEFDIDEVHDTAMTS